MSDPTTGLYGKLPYVPDALNSGFSWPLVAPKKGIRPILSHRSLRLKKRQSMGRNNFRILKSPQRSPFQSQTFISQLYTSVLIVKSLTNHTLQILSRQNIFENSRPLSNLKSMARRLELNKVLNGKCKCFDFSMNFTFINAFAEEKGKTMKLMVHFWMGSIKCNVFRQNFSHR